MTNEFQNAEPAVQSEFEPAKFSTFTLPFGMGKVEVAKVERPKVEFAKGQLPKVEFTPVEVVKLEVRRPNFEVRRPNLKDVDVKAVAEDARQRAVEVAKEVRGNVSHTVTLVREAVGI
jgi:hypothetical protein